MSITTLFINEIIISLSVTNTDEKAINSFFKAALRISQTSVRSIQARTVFTDTQCKPL